MLRSMTEEPLLKSQVIEMCILHYYLEQKKTTKVIAMEMETSLPIKIATCNFEAGHEGVENCVIFITQATGRN